jgi:hypothetical protein
MHLGFRVAGRFRLEEIVRAFTTGRAYLATDERSNRRMLAFEDAATRGSSVDQLVAWSGRSAAVLPVELVVRERVSVALFSVDRGTTLAELQRPRNADPMGPSSLADRPNAEVPPIVALPYARTLAGTLFEALATLHEAGLVHGGLAPRNVWVSPNGRVRLLGLGLYLDEASVAFAGHQQLWPYVAPERILPNGKPAKIGPTLASDMFSAALIAYACLAGTVPDAPAGRPAFSTSERAVSDQLAMLQRRATEEAPPLSSHAPLDDDLDAFFERALSARPGARYANARELLEAWRQLAPASADGVLFETAPSATEDALPTSAPESGPRRSAALEPEEIERPPSTERLPGLQARTLEPAVAATYRREEQEALFEAALSWVRADRPILPTDVVHALGRELTARVDQERARLAWEAAGAARAHVFVGSGDELHRVAALPSAREALTALSSEHRREVVAVLALLATNQAPRGVEPLGDPLSHLSVQVGEVRVLTCMEHGALVFVALASGWALPP